MPTSALRLEVAEFTDADNWRWVLKEHGDAFLADHTVALDRADPHYAGLVDLPSHLHRYAAPDTRDADERRHGGGPRALIWLLTDPTLLRPCSDDDDAS